MGLQCEFVSCQFILCTAKTGSAVSNSWNEGRRRENDTNSRSFCVRGVPWDHKRNWRTMVNNCRLSFYILFTSIFLVYMLSDMKRGILHHCVFQVNFHYCSDPGYQQHSKL